MNSPTTKSNLVSSLAGFSETELPQTLQDAIHVVSKLDIQYIWIDALCIVQDDINDWEKEAIQMSSIFQNAYVTIAATAAQSSSDGFLRRPNCCSLEMPFTVTKEGCVEQNGIFYARFPNRSNTSALISNSRWKRRGWTFQEQILSTRVLYVTDDILYFECLMAQKVEDNAYRIPSSLWIPWLQDARLIKKERSKLTSKGDNPYLDWYSLVEEYTNRKLSCTADKLSALSGLAQKFAQVTDGVYLAGLWKSDLRRGIMWKPKFREHMTRPSTYRAPSWSWAALDGAVEWGQYFRYLDHDDTFEIRTAEITLSNVHTTGRVIGGRLVISGRLLPVIQIMQKPGKWNKGAYFDPNTFEKAECDLVSELSLERVIQALLLTKIFGLLLQPTDDCKNGKEEYRRVGWFNCSARVFSQVKSSIVTII